jgi:hypothetical protein
MRLQGFQASIMCLSKTLSSLTHFNNERITYLEWVKLDRAPFIMQLSRIKKPNLNRSSIPDRGQGISKIVTKRQINLGHHPALDPDNLTMITLDPIVNIFSMINGKDLLADKKNQIRHNS